jgi:hypothetical protein
MAALTRRCTTIPSTTTPPGAPNWATTRCWQPRRLWRKRHAGAYRGQCVAGRPFPPGQRADRGEPWPPALLEAGPPLQPRADGGAHREKPPLGLVLPRAGAGRSENGRSRSGAKPATRGTRAGRMAGKPPVPHADRRRLQGGSRRAGRTGRPARARRRLAPPRARTAAFARQRLLPAPLHRRAQPDRLAVLATVRRASSKPLAFSRSTSVSSDRIALGSSASINWRIAAFTASADTAPRHRPRQRPR